MRRAFAAALCALSMLIMTMVVSAQSDGMSEPAQSYLICDWGLLTIQESGEQPTIYINITSPEDYSAVAGPTFPVSGTGKGLFEGNVIVRVTTPGSSEPLFEGTTILQTQEVGGEGTWSLDVDLSALREAAEIVVTAYSTSAEDGSTTALDSLRLAGNSQFGLPYVEIQTPTYAAGVNSSSLLVEGMAGAAFENNIVIQVQNFDSGEVLAETHATVQTDELAGSGPFSAELSFDAEPGTKINIYAFQPAVADGESVSISDTQFAIVAPLGQTYDHILVVQHDDPIIFAKDECAVTGAEFENSKIQPLVINNVEIQSTRSTMPLTHINIEATGSSNCPAPLRTRIIRVDNNYSIQVYLDVSNPVACTADLSPIPVSVTLGTLSNPNYSITVNGEPVDVE